MYQSKLPAPGNVNAAHLAFIYNKEGKNIGQCMDSPNNAAFAFLINPEVYEIHTPFNGVWKREELKSHFFGLNPEAHKKYIKFY